MTDTYEPELVVKDDGSVFYLSDDGLGHMIAWTSCHRYSGGCGEHIMRCNCKGGPVEPRYIAKWRAEARGEQFAETRRRTSATPVRDALHGRQVAQPGLSMNDFIDADVIARVKAASEEDR